MTHTTSARKSSSKSTFSLAIDRRDRCCAVLHITLCLSLTHLEPVGEGDLCGGHAKVVDDAAQRWKESVRLARKVHRRPQYFSEFFRLIDRFVIDSIRDIPAERGFVAPRFPRGWTRQGKARFAPRAERKRRVKPRSGSGGIGGVRRGQAASGVKIMINKPRKDCDDRSHGSCMT